MKSLTRKTSTSGRIGGALVAAAALLLPAALLTLAEGAAAQTAEPSEITIYHSLATDGADPRSETVPAGCTEGTSGVGGGAKTVAVFDNPSFVDTAGTAGNESDTIQASLLLLGHTVTTFTGISAADWQAAGASADVILIPELETGDLFSALDTAAQAAIANYVAAGGSFIISASYQAWGTALLNGVFGFGLVGEWPSSSTTLTLDAVVAAGTAFEGGPASVGNNDAVRAVERTSLPAEALDVYHDTTFNVVFVAPVGAGRVARLGWDWFDAIPLGSQDGGWLNVLDRTLDAVTGGGVSEPVCVLGGGTDEVLKIWIFGGSEESNKEVEPVETVCAQDFIDIPGEGAGNIIGGKGQEICGAALNFAITGPGRFKGVTRANPEVDAGIDTLVFGSPCPLANEGEGPECYFLQPDLKLLSMNFRTGGSTPNNLARHLVDLIVDTSLWTEGDETEISVGGQGGGAKLQLLTIESETVASLPVPEPTQFVQLLSGLFGLAGLNRLRRKH